MRRKRYDILLIVFVFLVTAATEAICASLSSCHLHLVLLSMKYDLTCISCLITAIENPDAPSHDSYIDPGYI